MITGLKLCLCVTGTTGSGKSTLVCKLGSMGWHTIHTGDLFRNSGLTVEGQNDPLAPVNGDAIIHDSLMSSLDALSANHVNNNTGPCLVAVETVPRKMSQITWIKEIRDKGWIVVLVGMDAKPSVRMSRVRSRDIFEPDRLKGDLAKLDVESNWTFWDRFPVEVLSEMQIVDTTEWQYTSVMEHGANVIATAMDSLATMAMNFYRHKKASRFEELGDRTTIVRMIERMIKEAEELRSAVLNKGVDIDAVEELVDTFWFLLMAQGTMCVEMKTLVTAFSRKYNINMDRMDKGHKAHLSTGDHEDAHK